MFIEYHWFYHLFDITQNLSLRPQRFDSKYYCNPEKKQNQFERTQRALTRLLVVIIIIIVIAQMFINSREYKKSNNVE